jgi:type VI secretion system secreted protein VgrG
MPSVFDAANKVARRVKDPRTDHTLPSPGSLNWKQITSATALSGATGVDVMLVHGDRWQEMKGSLTENYSVDKKITVKGKHTETITGNRSITVTSGNISRSVSSGSVKDQVAQSHEASVGMSFKLTAGQNVEQSAGMKHSVQATMVENTASAMATNKAGGIMTVQGSLVKINC